MLKASLLCFLTLSLLAPPTGAAGRQKVTSNEGVTVDAAALRDEVKDFLSVEVAAHLADIKSLDSQPERVLGAGSTGEYTWGTWARALAAYAELSGERVLAGRDLAREVGRVGLLEERLGSTRFSQLYCVLALRHFGRDLNSNAVWQSLTEDEKARWRKLLDVSAFYDAKEQKVINLPENYLGVAARIASVSYQLGLLKDRALLDGVVTRAARPFAGGGLYADDAPPTGRFDRYSNEYARFVWNAAEDAGRKDVLDALRPSLKAQMRLWWDLVQPDGYGYAWGRSLGVVSYLDTLEIVAWLARNPEFRPAPLAELAAAYYQAWRWLRHDYDAKAHKLSVFAFGRGNYSYISPDREWQQTTGFFGKAALAHMLFTEALAKENVKQFPSEIIRRDLARFEFFRRGERQAGVWLVRQGPLHFTLPLTTGTKPGVADYLPAPHGLPGFAAPVEQVYPSLVPFVELASGRVLVAADGADEIEPSADGKSLRAVWRRWAVVGSKSGQLVDPGISSEVVLSHEGTTLTREETLKASADVTIKRWWVAVPTTAARSEVLFDAGRRRDRFVSDGGTLEVSATADWPLVVSVQAAGGGALGRGARGGVPLHLVYEARDIHLAAVRPARWRITLKAVK
ncbi:MAG: hypothetical protein QOH49_2826 [Acidobacteriota bacterium]|jgi:hypothetical protein|nr:hypothetical protein [Acidobacteriota bacterium]